MRSHILLVVILGSIALSAAMFAALALTDWCVDQYRRQQVRRDARRRIRELLRQPPWTLDAAKRVARKR
jgi:hypothetical protein